MNLPYHVCHTYDKGVGSGTTSFPEGVQLKVPRRVNPVSQIKSQNAKDMEHSSSGDDEHNYQLEEF